MSKTYQKELFALIADKHGEAAYKSIEGLLKMRYPSVYDLRAGRTMMKFEDAMKLMLHFEVVPKEIKKIESGDGELSCEYTPMWLPNVENFEKYIHQLKGLLGRFTNQDKAKLEIIATDIPLFHLLPHKELAYFRFYTWAVESMYDGSKQKWKFEDFLAYADKHDLEGILAEIYEAYLKLPSAEYWNIYVLEPMLTSIHAYADLDSFRDRETIATLFRQVVQIYDTHLEWGKRSRKPTGVAFELYLSNVPFTGGGMLLSSTDRFEAVLNSYKINHLITTNIGLVSEAKMAILSIADHSSMIGRADYKTRLSFSKQIENRFLQTIHYLFPEEEAAWIKFREGTPTGYEPEVKEEDVSNEEV